MDRQGETAGERRTEDEWWHDLYEEGVPDTGPQRAGDTLDDRFASVARAVDEEADLPPAEADPPAPEPPSAAAAAEPRRASAEEPYDQMADPDYPPPSVAGVPGFEERPAPAGGRGWTDGEFAGLREDEGPSRRPPEDAKPRPERAVAPREPAGAADAAAPRGPGGRVDTPPPGPHETVERTPGDGAFAAAPEPAAPEPAAPEPAAPEPAAPDPADTAPDPADTAPDPADTAPAGSWEAGEPSWVDGVLSGPRGTAALAPAGPEPVGSPEPAEQAPADAALPDQRGTADRTAADAGPAEPSEPAEPTAADGEPARSREVGEPPWVDGVLSGRRTPAEPEPVGSPEPGEAAPPAVAEPGSREAGPPPAVPRASAASAPPDSGAVAPPPPPPASRKPPVPPDRPAPTASGEPAAPPLRPAAPAAAEPSPPPTMRLRQVSVTDTLTDAEWARRGGEFVGGGPPTYEAEPTALPEVAPGALAELVPDTVLDGARYGSFTLRTAATRGDSPRYRGEQRRDAVLTARFGGGDDALVFVAVATGARGVPRTDRAAESLVRWMGEAVGRSRARLSEDIRTGRRAALKGGLHRLTGRTYGLMRAQAEESGLDPAGYTAGLRCLLLSADPGCRTRVFFGTGPGGLFRLRGDEWQDLEPAPADEEPRQDDPGQDGPRQGDPRQGPAAPVDPRLTVDLGGRSARPAPAPGGPPPPGFGALVDTPDPGEPAPFAFRASEGRTGDVLLLCSPGFAEPLRGAPGLADELAERWRGEEAPPGLAAFLGDVQLRAKGFADDRTAAALWES
ncbi:protein phosphatase 2C domain-containing protein [Streptomyces sp. MAR4 CNY-716]